jgi:tripartite-type tricarboxylate transporter receptor subunit TctC
MAVMGSTPLIPHHKAGRIKILAFTTRERFPAMPDIPTLHESGLSGFDTSQWLGLLAPKGTAPEVISRLHAETAKVLAMPDVRQRLEQAALQAVGNTPSEFKAQIDADIERWTKLAHEIGIKPQ